MEENKEATKDEETLTKSDEDGMVRDRVPLRKRKLKDFSDYETDFSVKSSKSCKQSSGRHQDNVTKDSNLREKSSEPEPSKDDFVSEEFDKSITNDSSGKEKETDTNSSDVSDNLDVVRSETSSNNCNERKMEVRFLTYGNDVPINVNIKSKHPKIKIVSAKVIPQVESDGPTKILIDGPTFNVKSEHENNTDYKQTNKYSSEVHSNDINNDTPSSSNVTCSYTRLQVISESCLKTASESGSKIMCKLCNKALTNWKSLRRHLLINHLDNDEKKFICYLCDPPFYMKHNVRNHLKTHKDYKPFHCKICSMKFRQSSHVKDHLLSHANSVEYQCPLCDITFKREPSLLTHVGRHCKVNPFECPIGACEMKFATYSSLNSHIRLCEEVEDKIECKLCQRGLINRHKVISHMKMHENDNVYECQICHVKVSMYKKFVRHKIEFNHFTEEERGENSKTQPKPKHTPSDTDMPVEELLTMFEYVGQHDAYINENGDSSSGINLVHENVDDYNDVDLSDAQNEGKIEDIVKVETDLENVSPDQLKDRNSFDGDNEGIVAVLKQSSECSWSEIPVNEKLNIENNFDDSESTIIVTISDGMNASENRTQKCDSILAPEEVAFDSDDDVSVREWFDFSNFIHVKFECMFDESCSFTSHSYTEWVQHFRSVHSNDTSNGNLAYCLKCQFTCHEKRLLKKHVQVEHNDMSTCQIGLQHCSITSEVTGEPLNVIACIFCGFLMDEDNFEQMHECQHLPFCFYCPMCDYKEVVFDIMCSHIKSCHGVVVENEKEASNKHNNESIAGKDLASRIDDYETKCKKCESKFYTNTELKLHVNSVHELHSFSCGVCRLCYTSIESLREHMKKSHLLSHVCKYCQRRCGSKRDLKRHEATHISIRPFKCEHCDNSFVDKRALNVHIEVKHHTVSNNRKTISIDEAASYVCNLCGENLQTQKSLDQHRKQIHAENLDGEPDSFTCTICSTTFTNFDSFKLHSCNIKNDASSSQSDVKYNFNTLQIVSETCEDETIDSGRSVVKCKICSKPFRDRYGLRRHLLTAHLDENEKKYICHICDQRFHSEAFLKQHLKVHKDCRPYRCKICSKTFRQLSHVKEHLVLHSSDRKYQCPLCVLTFKSDQNLIHHVGRHCRVYPYECPMGICVSKFASLSSLNTHIRQCEEDFYEDVIKCKLCQQGIDKLEIIHHMKTHENDDNYECQICQEKFSKYKKFVRHKTNLNHFSDDERDEASSNVSTRNHQNFKITTESYIPSEELVNMYEYVSQEDLDTNKIGDNSSDANFVTENADSHDASNYSCLSDAQSEVETGKVIKVETALDKVPDQIDDGNSCTTNDNETAMDEVFSKKAPLVVIPEKSQEVVSEVMPQKAIANIAFNEPNSVKSCQVVYPSPINFILPLSSERKCSIQNVNICNDSPLEKNFDHLISDMSTCIEGQIESVHNKFDNEKGPQSQESHMPYMLSETNMNVDKVQGILTDTEAVISNQKLDDNNTNYKVRLCYYDDRSKRTNEYPYKCDFCDKRYKNRVKLNAHKKVHLPDNQRSFHCSVCGKGFNASYALRIHERIHSNVKPYKCTKCDKSFRQLGHLQVHLRVHADYRPFQCVFCEKTFISNCNLRKHARNCNNSTGPQLNCDKCQSSFNSIERLRLHQISHLDKTLKSDLVSKFCNVSLEGQSQDDSTWKRKRAKDKPVVCDICGKLVTHLKNHKSSHEINSFPCPHCTKVFTSSLKLKSHLSRTHTTKYLCDICGLELKCYRAAVKHAKTHKGDVYTCTTCNKVFAFQNEFFKHLLSCAGDKFISEIDNLTN